MAETEEFLGDFDEDLEAMQGTVYLLQQELKDAKERLQQQQLELDQFRARTAATTSNVNSVPMTACDEPSATVSVTTVDSSDSSDMLMKHVGKTSPELLRTTGKDSRVVDEKSLKKVSVEEKPLYDSHWNDKMDVDTPAAPRCSYTNDVRTSPTEHMNDDDAMSSEQLTDETGLRKTSVDRLRTVVKVSAAERTVSDCVPNGTDDDTGLTVASN